MYKFAAIMRKLQPFLLHKTTVKSPLFHYARIAMILKIILPRSRNGSLIMPVLVSVGADLMEINSHEASGKSG